jgi:hypothetical protein
MKRCIEVLVYKVKPEKVDDFIAINIKFVMQF